MNTIIILSFFKCLAESNKTNKLNYFVLKLYQKILSLVEKYHKNQ